MGLDSTNREIPHNNNYVHQPIMVRVSSSGGIGSSSSQSGSISPSSISLNNLSTTADNGPLSKRRRSRRESMPMLQQALHLSPQQKSIPSPPADILLMENDNGGDDQGQSIGNKDEINGDDDDGAKRPFKIGNSLGISKNNGIRRPRLESTEDSGDDSSEASSTLERAAPDGGWGWIVVAAAFMINLVADGVTFSFGIYYVGFINYFNQSKSSTAWIGSLLAAMPLLSGPIASSLTDRYGCRIVTIVGSFLSCLGFILSSFAKSIEVLYLTFGVLTGFGLSLCYVAAAVIVAYYFEQKRSLATGISVCGGGIGTFILAPLTQFLFDKYGWRNATRVLAIAFLLLSICGLLMRDLEWTKKSRHIRKMNNSPSDESSASREIVNSQPARRLCNSAICLPTFVREQERNSPSSHKFQNPNMLQRRSYIISHALSFPRPYSNNNNSQRSAQKLSDLARPSIVSSHLRTTSSATGVNKPILGNNITSPFIIQHPRALSGATQIPPTMTGFDVHRHSLTYRGAVVSLKRYRLRPASSCPDIISVATNEPSAHEWKAVMSDVCKWCHSLVEWRPLSSSPFILFVISNFLLYMWYDVVYIYLQDAAKQRGYSEDRSSYLISFLGLFNVVGNLVLGYMGDKEWADSTLIYGICMILCGISVVSLPTALSWSYVPLALDCGLFGLAIAANYSLTSVILVKVVSIERFASAYGLLLLVQGIGNLVGPPIAGAVYDWTGTSSWSFVIAGIGILLSSIFILVPIALNKCSTTGGSKDSMLDEEPT